MNIADIAVLSAESLSNSRDTKADIGANRMLLENNRLYNFVDGTMDFSGYKLLVLPDVQIEDERIIEKIKAFAENGGKVIASAKALTKDGQFFLDCGAEFTGENEFNPTYFVPAFPTVNGTTEYVMRCNSYTLDAKDCIVEAYVQNPYFNRTREHFCSHAHTPNNPDEQFPAVVIKENIAYIGWDIFTAYANHGHLCFKEIFTQVLDKLMGDNFTVDVKIPDKAVVTYTRQEEEKRNILHLLFAHTTVRGSNTEVIEDTVPLYNVECSVKKENKPSEDILQPEGKAIPLEYTDGNVKFIVPEVDIHRIVVIED